MGVELKLVIGEIWSMEEDSEYLANLQDYHREFGRSIHEIASVDLSGVDDSVWVVVREYQKQAKEQDAETGVHWTISTDHTERREDGVYEVNYHEDRYGDRIACIPLQKIYEALMATQKIQLSDAGQCRGNGYRRYDIALAVMDAMFRGFPEHERLVALTYGH